ncbi:MAG: hypothetical protein IT497_08610, partial [Ottowia sp.]|nr:hypothetical protein [Ottowia sp.]
LPLLPSELTFLNVSNNALETLPSLPNKLQHLECGGNRLHHLPTLPPNLCKLFADHNHLVCLPNTLPATLTSLIISNNELTQLNNLPPQLDHLDAAFNRLRFLPPLPDTLKNLFVNHNRIFTAPESLPAQIKYISLAHNQLTHLPENILSLSSDSRIFLENNPLPRRALRHLAELVNAPDYQGPYIYFSMGNLNSDHTQPLHHAAAHWYPQKEQKHIRKTWQSFCNEAHAGEFSQFLDQLHDTVNVHNKPFRTSVNSWLAQLADDNVLRAHVFTIANDALGSCEDRITLTYNTMKKEGINLDVYRGKYDTQTNQLLLLAQQMFRLDALEKIAYEKITHLRFVDDVEVYLAYQTRLREPLQLAIDTPNMRFFDVAYVTQADLDAAYARVKQEEKTQFMPYLNLDWAPWQSVLQRCYPEEFSIAQEKISIMVDTQFSEKQTAYLQSQQLTDNEFHRITTAEQVRRDIAHEILSPLTHRLIHENRDPRDTLAIPPQAD